MENTASLMQPLIEEALDVAREQCASVQNTAHPLI